MDFGQGFDSPHFHQKIKKHHFDAFLHIIIILTFYGILYSNYFQ